LHSNHRVLYDAKSCDLFRVRVLVFFVDTMSRLIVAFCSRRQLVRRRQIYGFNLSFSRLSSLVVRMVYVFETFDLELFKLVLFRLDSLWVDSTLNYLLSVHWLKDLDLLASQANLWSLLLFFFLSLE